MDENYMDSLLFEEGNISDYGNGSLGGCQAFSVPDFQYGIRFVYGFICILGLLGNTLVIFVVLRYSKMKTVTNMYIVNLAIADECFLVGLPFLITTMSTSTWLFGKLMCKIYMLSQGINQFTSSIFLCVMSADRYLAICHPIAAPRFRTPLISRIVSGAAWTISVTFMLPIFLYANLITHETGVTCNIIWPEKSATESQTIFTLYTFFLGFAAPLALIFVFYCLVIKKLKTLGPKNKLKDKKRPHKKVTRLVLTVIAVYVICWLPYWLFQLVLINLPTENYCLGHVYVTVFLTAGCFSYSNSAINPVLYAFLSENFKKTFLKVCTCTGGKDINAQLHVENSLFNAKKKLAAERSKAATANNRMTLSLPPHTKSELSVMSCRSSVPSESENSIMNYQQDRSRIALSTHFVRGEDSQTQL